MTENGSEKAVVDGREFSILPRGEVDGRPRFALVVPHGDPLPLRALTANEADVLACVLNAYLDKPTAR
jgi:hypothetical protein